MFKKHSIFFADNSINKYNNYTDTSGQVDSYKTFEKQHQAIYSWALQEISI